jgi:hypothetical protein
MEDYYWFAEFEPEACASYCARHGVAALALGSHSCQNKQLAGEDMLAACRRAGVSELLFITGPLNREGLARTREALAVLASQDEVRVEVMVNDWGLLPELPADGPLGIVLGINLLNLLDKGSDAFRLAGLTKRSVEFLRGQGVRAVSAQDHVARRFAADSWPDNYPLPVYRFANYIRSSVGRECFINRGGRCSRECRALRADSHPDLPGTTIWRAGNEDYIRSEESLDGMPSYVRLVRTVLRPDLAP